MVKYLAPVHGAECDRAIRELIEFIDQSPAVTWGGHLGAKERALTWLAERDAPSPLTTRNTGVTRVSRDDLLRRRAQLIAELAAVRAARAERDIERDLDTVEFLLGD